jgi:TolB-like protein/DNA-binding winged helix-turn-helix (wHTH) protein
VTDEPTVFAFGEFEADEALRELRRAGRPVELQATPLRLLLYLLRNRDRVISKDELLDRVWSETAVSEGALTTALKEIRSALGDTGSQQRVIQTLRGQGYRLIAPVEERPATAPGRAEPGRGAGSRARSLIQEIHRRSLWQVLGIYLVGAWVAFQGIEAIASGLDLPQWVPGFAVVLLIVGLPIVLATAFVQEGVGVGEVPVEATAASEAGQATTVPGGAGLHLVLTWRNVVLAGALVFGLAGIAAAGWVLLGGETAPSPETIRSIAVLPFADMSSGGDQEYFADGMSEELINRLSKMEDLRVVARTSAFAFKGKNVDIREIGKQLGVGAVVEGSVRKAGDRLRITAQLVQVADGYHLWSETYDRQLDDVFAIQDERLRAVRHRTVLLEQADGGGSPQVHRLLRSSRGA